MAKERRFSGIKDVINHLNAVGSRGLAAIGSKSKAARLLEDEKVVTLQVGKSVFDGAPRNMRTELWMSSLQRKGIGVAASQKYEDMLLSPVGAEAAADIEKDLGRTFPATRRFASAEGQETLMRVLRAYAALDPEVGYCQGMNFVAGLLLMYLPERHAFGGLVVLMQDRGLRNYYSTDMSLVQTHLWQLGRLMPSRLCSHLESIGVLPLLYGASWLMTCFSADFPASFSARVMDVIMADKMDQALLKAAVALLKRCEGKLLQMQDMEDALHLLKLELPAWEEPLLHDVLTDAFSKPWSSRQTQLLGSMEGAETVSEALERVQKANLAASIDSTVSVDSAAAAEDLDVSAGGAAAAAAHSLGGSRATTPASPPASAGGSAGGGTAAAGVAALPLFPPPPSPKRPSSAGGTCGTLSPVVGGSRATSRAGSQCGAVRDGPTAAHGAADPLDAAAVAPSSSSRSMLQAGVSPVSTQPLRQQQQQQQQHREQQHDMIDMSSPRAAAAVAGDSHWQQAAAARGTTAPHQQLQQQQQHTQCGSSWDPFGIGDVTPHDHQQQQQVYASSMTQSSTRTSSIGSEQQQQQHSSNQQQAGQARAADGDVGRQQLHEQLQDLSFSLLSSSPHMQQQQQHQAEPSLPQEPSFHSTHGTQQQQQHAAEGSKHKPAPLQQQQQLQPAHLQQPHHVEEDEWGDFLSPNAATQQ